MRAGRGPRSSTSTKPLGRAEMATLFEARYTRGTLHHIALQWGIAPTEVDPQVLLERLFDEPLTRKRLAEIQGPTRAVLGQVAATGGRMRGESLRRDLLLRGFGETAAHIKEAMAKGLLFLLPSTGDLELDLDHTLEHDTFLQHELALTEILSEQFEGEATLLGPGAVHGFSGPIAPTSTDSLDTLEINLLHLASAIAREGLRLNKSGMPHRRGLHRVASGLIFPDGQGEAGDDLDLSDTFQLDYVSYLLALSVEMELIRRKEGRFEGHHAGLERYFRGSLDGRHRLLLEGLQNLRYWSELDSVALEHQRAPLPPEEQFSQLENTGEGFIGARGYVVSVLRRAQLKGWTPFDALVELCDSLDRSYLRRTLDRAAHGVDTKEFIEALLRRTLAWSGIVELGMSDDGMALARFTERGRRLLGHEQGPPESALQTACLIVQPNFEVMVFIDAAPLSLLYMLYRIGERARQADRVATFRLSAESVQRGFSLGHDADEIVDALGQASHAPLPESVSFELRDWERVHRNVEMYCPGYLVRHHDEEQFELQLGQLFHELGPQTQTLRLDARSAFILTDKATIVDRFIARHQGLVFTYDEGPIHACLYFVDPLTLMLDPMRCDIVTRREVERISERLDEQADDGSLFFEICPERARKRWPENTLENVLAFFDARVAEGTPAEEALRLRSVLEAPPRSRVLEQITVLVVEEASVAQRLAEVEEAQSMIVERLGDRAFAIDATHQHEFEALLTELGFIWRAE